MTKQAKATTINKTNDSFNLGKIKGNSIVFSTKSTNYTKKIDKINQSKSRKIIIFEINPDNDQITSEFLKKNVKNILKTINQDPNYVIVFASFSKFDILYDLVVRILGLSKAWLISNGGARLYSCERKKFIINSTLSDTQKLAISHIGSIQSFCIIASTLKQDLIYSSNYISLNKFKYQEYMSRNSTDDYLSFNNFVKLNNICSYLLFEKNEQELLKKYQSLQNVCNDYELEITSINQNMFLISQKGYNYVNSVYEIMRLKHIENFSNIYYISLNSFTPNLWYLASNEKYISLDCIVANSYFLPKKINFEDHLYIPSQFSKLLLSISENKKFSFNNSYITAPVKKIK